MLRSSLFAFKHPLSYMMKSLFSATASVLSLWNANDAWSLFPRLDATSFTVFIVGRNQVQDTGGLIMSTSSVCGYMLEEKAILMHVANSTSLRFLISAAPLSSYHGWSFQQLLRVWIVQVWWHWITLHEMLHNIFGLLLGIHFDKLCQFMFWLSLFDQQ